VVVGIAPTGVKAAITAIDFASNNTLASSFYGSGHPAAEIPEPAGMVASGTIDLAESVSHTTDLPGIEEAFRPDRGEGARTLVTLDEGLAG